MLTEGMRAALARYGLEKTAWSLSGLRQGLKSFAIGDPKRVWSELQAGKLFAPGGAMRDFAWPTYDKPWKTWGARALNYGVPALGIMGSLSAPAQRRGSEVGENIGQVAGSALGAPLGLAGSVVGGSLLGSLGKGLGSVFNARKPPAMPRESDQSYV
jgi:hypothetical protein